MLAAAVEDLPPTWYGRYFDVVGSTQDEARAAAREGAPSRSIFVADYQRAGRGRQGRTWLSRPGLGLLVSMIFREADSTPIPWRWTNLASVALVEAMEELLPSLRPSIKWPNDVMLHERKVAGVLAETTWDGQHLVAIVGVGVNVNAQAADLASLGDTATSLSIASGRGVNRGQVLSSFVRHIDRWLDEPTNELHKAWEARLWGRGQRVRLRDVDRDEEVIVLGGEPDGSLRVRTSDGVIHRTTTGELIL